MGGFRRLLAPGLAWLAAGCSAPDRLDFGTGGATVVDGTGAADEPPGGRAPDPPSVSGSGDAGMESEPGGRGSVPDAGADESGTSEDPRPITGTFPPTADLAAEGDYGAVRTGVTFSPGSGIPQYFGSDALAGDYTVFYPEPLGRYPAGSSDSAEARHPIVAWANGRVGTSVNYPLLPHLASHGFVVIAPNNAPPTTAQVRRGVEWLLGENDNRDSLFYHKLDVTQLAGVGLLEGGLPAYEVAELPHLPFVTLVIISGAFRDEALRNEHLPFVRTLTAYLCTADQREHCAADFAVTPAPAFYGYMVDSSVPQVTTTLPGATDLDVSGRLNRATTGWLRWQLMEDRTHSGLFLDAALCGDAAAGWTVCATKRLQD